MTDNIYEQRNWPTTFDKTWEILLLGSIESHILERVREDQCLLWTALLQVSQLIYQLSPNVFLFQQQNKWMSKIILVWKYVVEKL